MITHHQAQQVQVDLYEIDEDEITEASHITLFPPDGPTGKMIVHVDHSGVFVYDAEGTQILYLAGPDYHRAYVRENHQWHSYPKADWK